jgi:hypothetical protein
VTDPTPLPRPTVREPKTGGCIRRGVRPVTVRQDSPAETGKEDHADADRDRAARGAAVADAADDLGFVLFERP